MISVIIWWNFSKMFSGPSCFLWGGFMIFGFRLASGNRSVWRTNQNSISAEFVLFPVQRFSTDIRSLSSAFNWLNNNHKGNFSTAHPDSDRSQMPDSSETAGVYNVEFEVFGLVQGVFFRKYTQRHAQDLGLTGWVQNTPRDTVIGQLQGSKEAVAKMKDWLSNSGSPHSKVDKCEFRGEGPVSKKSFTSFDVRH